MSLLRAWVTLQELGGSPSSRRRVYNGTPMLPIQRAGQMFPAVVWLRILFGACVGGC